MSKPSPDEEAEVSRLLGDAASPVTMPPEVAARLDDVLAGLVAEREAESPDRTDPDSAVVPLRSPRRWTRVLVAAAAVSLFGYVGTQFVQGGGSADMGSAAPESAASGDGQEDAGGSDGPQDRQVPRPSAEPLAPPPGPGVDEGAAALRDSLRAMLSYDLAGRSLSDGVWQSTSGEGTFTGSVPCATPASDTAGDDSYNVSLPRNREAVVVLQRLTRTAARAYVYPCHQTVVPYSTSLVLGLALR